MAKDTLLKLILGGAGIALLVLAILAIPGAWKSGQQATALPEQTAQQAAILTQGGNPDLTGRTVTLSVFANDYSSSSPTSTHAAAPFYLCVDPKEDGANLKCDDNYPVDQGTVLSTTTSTSVSNGVSVGKTVRGASFNATWYGDLGESLVIPSQAAPYTVKVYRVAANGKLTLKDVDQNAVIKGTRNITVSSASGEHPYTFYSLKVENNNSARVWDVWGVYFDLAASTNISRFDGSDTNRLDGTTYDPHSNIDLGRTSADDKRLVFSKVVRLKEYDSIVLNDLTLVANSNGCGGGVGSGEDVTMYVVDANRFVSSKFNGIGYGPETDAPSPADVGASDYSQTFTCE